ncbi:unnamed protein product [Brassica oleracea var. botrytis]
MWISIPKRHIVVFDSICSSISPKELDVVMEPFLYMVPYLLVECASSDEQRAQYSLEPFTYERPTNIPPARTGDCGVYTLNKKDFAKANGKTMRDKMVVDIFQELPDAHEFENKDNDANLGAYEGRLTVKSSGMLDDLTISSLESLLSSDLLARPSQICLVVQFDKEVDTDKFITQIFNT